MDAVSVGSGLGPLRGSARMWCPYLPRGYLYLVHLRETHQLSRGPERWHARRALGRNRTKRERTPTQKSNQSAAGLSGAGSGHAWRRVPWPGKCFLWVRPAVVPLPWERGTGASRLGSRGVILPKTRAGLSKTQGGFRHRPDLSQTSRNEGSRDSPG